jgi:photosystem II stability/assembly factor-like uncharacterized protein
MLGEGVLSASFIPVYARLRAEGRQRDSSELAEAIFALLAVLASTIVALGILCAPLLVSLLVPGFHGEKRDLTIALVRIVFPGTGLLVFSAWSLGVLNSHGRFFLSYASAVMMNIAMIAALLWQGSLHHGGSVSIAYAISWATVVGALLQFGVQAPAVYRCLRPLIGRIELRSIHVAAVVAAFGPVFVSRGILQISGFIDLQLASFLPRGNVLLTYAQTLYMLPFSLIAASIAAVELAEQAIAVDPHGSGTIFMGSIAGGVRKSVDRGISWSAVNTGLTSLIVQALAMDASGPQTVYAATVGGGLFKTGDGGATWQNIPAISALVESVAADPNRSGVVYAAVFMNWANGSIRKSIDGGVTWATIFPTTAAIFNITIDPGNSDVLYAPTVGHGAFKSTDGGQRWSPMSALTPAAIWTLALDPANTQVLYAGTSEDGIWKSTDAGNIWQQVGSPGAFPVYSLTVDGSAAHTIYAGTNGGGVWTSSDGGVTWQSTGLSNGMVWSLALDSAGALYAGTNAAGAQASRDRGATWTMLRAGIDAANKFGNGVWIDPSNSQKIFVSSETPYGMVWSEDGGASWSVAGAGFTGFGSRGVAFDPSDSQRIYAGAMVGNAFFKSTDGGVT